VASAVASLGDRFVSVYGYDPVEEAAPWRTYDPGSPPEPGSLTTLYPGQGYWIEVTEAGDWVLQSAP